MSTNYPDHTRLTLLGRTGGALALLLAFAGCQTYTQQSQEFGQAMRSGDLRTAVVQVDAKAKDAAGGKDEVLWRLEQGATMRAAGLANPAQVPDIRPPAKAPKKGEPPPEPVAEPTEAEVHAHYMTRSLEAFDLAEVKVNDWEEQAKVKVGAELGAALTNQANLPYRGRSYDKVMMNTYKALNYLALGDKDKARVELNRSLQRQRDAVAENEKRIVAAKDDEEKARNGELKDDKGQSAAYDSQKAMDDPRTGPALQAALAASIAPMKPYGDYVNPFAVFLDGLFYTELGVDGSDFERGRKSFERVAGMVPENAYLRADLEAATLAAEGKQTEGITYVIFETGTAPARDQVRIDIPTFLVTSNLAYVGAAFPKLVYNDDYVHSLGIAAGEQTFETATVASMDSVVANDFKNEWPTIVTKTIITTATKAIVQAAAQKQLNDQVGGWGALLGNVVLSAVNAATNIADTRTWNTLPKEFQYARLATPANRQLVLKAGGAERSITLDSGSINVVYVKSESTAAPLLVSQFVLK